MNRPLNPIARALRDRGVSLPDLPIDLADIFRSVEAERAYIICMTGRCGSTWLASSLAQIPECGNPLEYFSEEAIPHYGKPDGSGDLSQYLRSVIETQRTGKTFGLKIDVLRLGWLSELCDLKSGFALSPIPWIDMRRLNIVKQAFSFARAKKTGLWHLETSTEKDKTNILYSQALGAIPDHMIWQEIIELVRVEKTIDQFYIDQAINPLRIFYEELLDSKVQLLLRVLDHLFPDRSFTADQIRLPDATRKISTERNDDGELGFTERHVKDINMIFDFRSSSNTDIQKITQALRRKTAP